jgi:hypothetical protein
LEGSLNRKEASIQLKLTEKFSKNTNTPQTSPPTTVFSIEIDREIFQEHKYSSDLAPDHRVHIVMELKDHDEIKRFLPFFGPEDVLLVGMYRDDLLGLFEEEKMFSEFSEEHFVLLAENSKELAEKVRRILRIICFAR